MRVKQGLQVAFEQRVTNHQKKKSALPKAKAFSTLTAAFRWIITHRGQMVRTYVYNRKTITEYLHRRKNRQHMESQRVPKPMPLARIVALIKSPHELKRDYVVKEQQQTNNKLQLLLAPRENNDIQRCCRDP